MKSSTYKSKNFPQSDLLENANNPSSFFRILFNAQRGKEAQEYPGSFQKIAIDFINSNIDDICELAVESIKQGTNVFDLIHFFEHILPSLNLRTKSFTELLEIFFSGTKNDHFASLQFGSISSLVSKQPGFSREVLDCLKITNRPFVTGYISKFFVSISRQNGNKTKIHEEIIELTNCKHNHVLHGAINALGNFEYTNEKSRLLKRTFQVMQTLEERGEDIEPCLIHAYGNLLRYGQAARTKIFEFSLKNKSALAYPISTILFHHSNELSSEDWYLKTLMSLSNTTSEDKGALDNIDYILSSFIKKKDHFEIAEEFFLSWIIQSDHKFSDEKLPEIFDSTFIAFLQPKQKHNFSRLLTRLLNHDNYKAHLTASQLLDFNFVHKLSPPKLDPKTLKSLNIRDILFIGRKILGYVFNPINQQTLAFSLLDKAPNNRHLQNIVSEIFVNHIGKEYPHSTAAYMEERIKDSKGVNRKKVAQYVLSQVNKSIEEWKSLPDLKETSPKQQQVRNAFMEQQKVMARSLDDAQKGSIVNLFRKIPLKYGSGSFMHQESGYTAISKLSEHSTSVELPLSEIFYPVQGTIEIVGFRHASREK